MFLGLVWFESWLVLFRIRSDQTEYKEWFSVVGPTYSFYVSLVVFFFGSCNYLDIFIYFFTFGVLLKFMQSISTFYNFGLRVSDFPSSIRQ